MVRTETKPAFESPASWRTSKLIEANSYCSSVAFSVNTITEWKIMPDSLSLQLCYARLYKISSILLSSSLLFPPFLHAFTPLFLLLSLPSFFTLHCPPFLLTYFVYSCLPFLLSFYCPLILILILFKHILILSSYFRSPLLLPICPFSILPSVHVP